MGFCVQLLFILSPGSSSVSWSPVLPFLGGIPASQLCTGPNRLTLAGGMKNPYAASSPAHPAQMRISGGSLWNGDKEVKPLPLS